MKKIRKKIMLCLFALMFVLLSCKVYAYNYETTELRVYSLRDGFKLCAESPLMVNSHNLYIWSTFENNNSLQAWPGVPLTQDSGDIYCYTYHKTDDTRYDYVIFNGDSKQTIDLSAINDSKGIINALLYKFDESGKNSQDKYVGTWYVYDTSKLVELVSEAVNLDSKNYTIDSYNAVKNALGDKVDANTVTESNKDDYNLGAYYISKLNSSNDILNKLIINYSSSEDKYVSLYVDKYNELATALNNLQKRKDIVVDSNISNGIISADYIDNSDSSINIAVNPNTGYRLKSLRVSKILSYDTNNQPVLGESTDIDINNHPYSYSFNENDNMVGLYITGTFQKNKYKLVFQVGENGTISKLDDGEVLSPVTVEYDDNYNLKIKANEGYEINKVLVDGVEYQLTDGVLELKNIRKDTNVEISFKIKMFNIKIDGEDYSFPYGTTYEEMLKNIDVTKSGYTFKCLKDKDGNVLDDSYVVKENAELKVEYEEIKKESKNPYTVDSIIKYFAVFVLSAVMFCSISYILLKRNKKKIVNKF